MNVIAPQPVRRGSSRRRRFLGLAVLVLILVIAVTAFNAVRTPVHGHLILGVHVDDHNCDIFVGDRLVGTGCAKVTWTEILGWHGHKPLGILLPKDAAWPPVAEPPGDNAKAGRPHAPPVRPSPMLTVAEATGERLAGQGATVVHLEPGSPSLSSYGGSHRFAHKEMLIRRADGMLDHVLCLDAGFTDVLGKKYRVLVPIRIRPRDSGDARIFQSSSNYATHIERDGNKVVAWGHAAYPRNGWIHRYSHQWGFQRVDPPEQFADELRDNGQWKPGS